MIMKKSRKQSDFFRTRNDFFRADRSEDERFEEKEGENFDFSPSRVPSAIEAIDSFEPRVVARFPNLGHPEASPAGHSASSGAAVSSYLAPLRRFLFWGSGAAVGAGVTAALFLSGMISLNGPEKPASPTAPEEMERIVQTGPSLLEAGPIMKNQVDLNRVVTAPNDPKNDTKIASWDESSLESIPVWSEPTAKKPSEAEATLVAAAAEPNFPAASDFSGASDFTTAPTGNAGRGNPYETFGTTESTANQIAASANDMPTWNQLSAAAPPVFDPGNGPNLPADTELVRPMKNDLVPYSPTLAAAPTGTPESIGTPETTGMLETVETPASGAASLSMGEGAPRPEFAANETFYQAAYQNQSIGTPAARPVTPEAEIAAAPNRTAAPSATTPSATPTFGGSNFAGYRVASEPSAPSFTPISGNSGY